MIPSAVSSPRLIYDLLDKYHIKNFLSPWMCMEQEGAFVCFSAPPSGSESYMHTFN